MKTKKINNKKQENGIFLVILLGIIFDPSTRKILIGKRIKDKYLKKLTWAFPGGRPYFHEDLEKALKREIKEETNLNVESLGSVFAKVYPEKENLLAIYYLCEIKSGKEKPGEDFVELKWVNPEELQKYFKTSTSFHPKLKEYILNLK
jgi:8-oxo-dGTP diphosphatase